MKNLLYCLLLLSFFYQKTMAQQTSRFSQSADEFGLDNPAGLSIEEMRYRGMAFSVFVRQQWWKNASSGNPQSQTFTWLNNRSTRQHFGMAIMADKIGETRQFGFLGRYAHQLAPGLKAGISAGLSSWHLNINNLDQYDKDDPLAVGAGEVRMRMSVGAGIFYHRMQGFKNWNWFCGLSFRQTFFLGDLAGSSEASPQVTHLLAQGGLGWNGWWAGGRLRVDLRQPDAVDVYLRKFISDYNYFVGALVSSDFNNYTAGVQLGGQWAIGQGSMEKRQYINASLGFSKPFSAYLTGSNLIFDARVTWSLANKRT